MNQAETVMQEKTSLFYTSVHFRGIQLNINILLEENIHDIK